ncbi:MAG: ribosome-associated protein [Maribacter sp.]
MNTNEEIKRLSTEEMNALIIDSIQDIKGKNISLLDLRHLDDAPTDFFIVCSGESTVQVKGIAGNIQARLKKEADTLPSHIEGTDTSVWVLVDYFVTVVHVFYPETREFYQLEELWSDAKVTKYEDIV